MKSISLLAGAAIAAALAGFATSASAGAAVTLTSDALYYSGFPYTLGFSFMVSGTQSIAGLGAFDQDGDGLGGSAQVGLWSASGGLLTSVVVPAGTAGALVGEFRYGWIPRYTLSPGLLYYIGAYEPADNATSLFNGNGGSGFFDPNVIFVADQFSLFNASFTFPDHSDGFAGPWLGANFAIGGIPEPVTWSMMLAGFGGLGGAMRRQRGKQTACI